MFFDMDIHIFLLLIAFGFLAAFIDSVVGGGGLISLPALLFAGLNPAAAVATNKLAGSMGSLTSTISFYRSGQLEIRPVLKYFPLAFIGSLFGAWTVHLINPALLKPLMLVMLAAVAVYTIFKKDWGAIAAVKTLSRTHLLLFMALLFSIGFYDGFLGPGTGSFLIFSFLLVGFDFLKAAGNAKFLNLASNVAGLCMFAYLGQIHYVYGLVMGIAQIAGAVVGSRLAIQKGSGFVRILFIVVTITLLAKNAYDYLT
ncbi:TSUP family transporter [Lysinibacillus macroides]|uniref:Probable membrane transporter protein n=1 Tax=Lysinibacillus macroides TaxID=33935 RepID=A0A0N0CVH3_9BACI|nr:TSUP family transporter [Lysinibacillus macroides]KOY81624.1 membrane protein [Lysinibacillus macroides]QPR69529.1 TSUP family transporter [Lysinibacillus macroides]